MSFLRKKMNKKGFTLAELLIVVAIIAVLVAVSIPIFTGRLEKAREETDIANMRSAKAAGTVALLDDVVNTDIWQTKDGGKTYEAYYDAEAGEMKKEITNINPYGKGTKADGGGKFGSGDSTYKPGMDHDGKVIKVKITLGTSESDNGNVDLYWEKKQ